VLLSLQDLKKQVVSDVLIPALEHFKIDITIGRGTGMRVHPFPLSRFTFTKRNFCKSSTPQVFFSPTSSENVPG
jgi:hypothetical protein